MEEQTLAQDEKNALMGHSGDDSKERRRDLLDFYDILKTKDPPPTSHPGGFPQPSGYVTENEDPPADSMYLFAAMSAGYLYYRAEAEYTFALNPFSVGWDDCWG
eukprot:CAMPEP_0119490232 /NCGR_PEP_ID=MMETSP1344-20130328/15468_1 /TAXON_ID=236787 /ORGANISM="Florenciella parvula, Strain CCMP2471" /LENGTH=103 /DNA_ID=CAMNT_0007525357 /DNA_START=17 /DNA_END=325 /DNA_ORIENTATION=-